MSRDNRNKKSRSVKDRSLDKIESYLKDTGAMELIDQKDKRIEALRKLNDGMITRNVALKKNCDHLLMSARIYRWLSIVLFVILLSFPWRAIIFNALWGLVGLVFG